MPDELDLKDKITPPAGPLFSGGFAGMMSIILRFVYIIAGLYVFWNFIVAGYKLMSAAGNPEKVSEAWETIWKSLLGLIIIVTATVFAALIGWLFFDNPRIILAPELIVSE